MQLGAAADEAGRQDPPGAGVEERAPGHVRPRPRRAGRDGRAQGMVGPAVIQHQLRPSERVRLPRRLGHGGSRRFAVDCAGRARGAGHGLARPPDGEAGGAAGGDLGIEGGLGLGRQRVEDRAAVGDHLSDALAVQPRRQALDARPAFLQRGRVVAVAVR